jgi:uncharacterized protein YjbI with pentapeptide repeats
MPDPLSGYEKVDDPRFEEKFGRKPRRNQAQLDLLQWCRAKEDIAVWDDWRCDGQQRAEVWLEGADLTGAHLKGANLRGAELWRAHLERVKLEDAHLEGAYLRGATLKQAHLVAANLHHANLEYCNLINANLTGASLAEARMRNVDLSAANLKNADLRGAHLGNSHLENAFMRGAKLEGANFRTARVDGETCLDDCTVDENTDFSGVGMGSCRMEPGLREALEYNIRRKRWDEWCAGRSLLGRITRWFLWTSDYGLSTCRIIKVFLALSVAFGLIYWFSEMCGSPGMVQNLSRVESTDVPKWLVPFRAQYFSVVTMTTLGFGDMHANPHSLIGHFVLAFQVVLGYILLGALICRLAILFQGLGPPVDFAPTWKPSKKKLDS